VPRPCSRSPTRARKSSAPCSLSSPSSLALTSNLPPPSPHSRPGEVLCRQRNRQPSLPELYRRKRRQEHRSRFSKALLTYSLALDMLCER
jgi:hypothetical protein